MYIKIDKRDPLFDVRANDITDTYLIENQSAQFEFDENNQAKYVDCFSASFTGTEFVTLNNTFGSSNEYTTSGLAYMLQSMFFPDDSIQGHNYITHPWNGESITTLHCISLNHNLFKDKLLGFNYDVIITIDGNTFGASYFGKGTYDSPDFVYTETTEKPGGIEYSDIFTSTITNNVIEKLSELGYNYSFVTGIIYNQVTSYRITGILFNDYGLIVFFNNDNNWSGWNDARFICGSNLGSASGSIQNPAVFWKFQDQINFFKYEQTILQKNINIKCDWLNCNYSSNETIYNALNGEYKFKQVETMEDLIQLSENQRPRTYLSKIKLFDDQFNVVAEASLSKPIKKDFLTNLNFNVKVKL